LGPSSNVRASSWGAKVCRTVGPNNSAEAPTAPHVAAPVAVTAATVTPIAKGFKGLTQLLAFDFRTLWRGIPAGV
jgi:hypothetical protein